MTKVFCAPMIFRVRRDKLTADRLMDFSQNCLDLGAQIVCRITTEIFNSRLVQAQGIPEFFRCGADRSMDIARGQAVN